MKEFDIFLEGTWHFYYSIEANSKEEAIKQAMKDMEEESRSIDLYHTNQWFDGEAYTILANSQKFFSPPTQGAYFRVKYTNGGVAQTNFDLLHRKPV